MAPKEQKSKAAKALAAQSGGKGKKKKWSKGKMKEQVNNDVVFKKETIEKLKVEVPKYKLITPSVLADRLRVNGSLARQAIRVLENEGLIKCISRHHNQQIYTRTTAVAE